MKAEPTKDKIAPKGCIDMEILKVLGKDKLEALLWYVPNDLKEDFVSCLNHSLKPFIEKETSPSSDAAILKEGERSETELIAEFENKFQELVGRQGWTPYNARLEAARNLLHNQAQAIFADVFDTLDKEITQDARNLVDRKGDDVWSSIKSNLQLKQKKWGVVE